MLLPHKCIVRSLFPLLCFTQCIIFHKFSCVIVIICNIIRNEKTKCTSGNRHSSSILAKEESDGAHTLPKRKTPILIAYLTVVRTWRNENNRLHTQHKAGLAVLNKRNNNENNNRNKFESNWLRRSFLLSQHRFPYGWYLYVDAMWSDVCSRRGASDCLFYTFIYMRELYYISEVKLYI